MHRLDVLSAALVLTLALTGCGGGLSEGFPASAAQGLTPAQEKQHQELMDQEKEQAKIRKTEQAKAKTPVLRKTVRRGP